MGSPLLAIFSVLPVINAVTVILAGVVIGLCAFLSRASGHIPDWMIIPPLMMSGNNPPESVIYSSGFTIVAVGLFFSQFLLFLLRRAMLHRDIKPTDKNYPLRFLNVCEFSFSVAAIIALVVQAVIPVQKNVLYTFFDFDGIVVEQDTLTHETAAACWWLGEAVHWILNFILEKRSPQLSIFRKYRSFIFKYAFAAIGIICGCISMFAKPDLPAPKSKVLMYFHVTNLCWWASAVCFFITYFVQSWQSASLLDHLGIRSFVFGTLSNNRPVYGQVPDSERYSEVEEGKRKH